MTFAETLKLLLEAKGWRKADLARALWGSTIDARGYMVARNRDRISHYFSGHSFPKPKTIIEIADVLGADPNMLESFRPKLVVRIPSTVVVSHLADGGRHITVRNAVVSKEAADIISGLIEFGL